MSFGAALQFYDGCVAYLSSGSLLKSNILSKVAGLKILDFWNGEGKYQIRDLITLHVIQVCRPLRAKKSVTSRQTAVKNN